MKKRFLFSGMLLAQGILTQHSVNAQQAASMPSGGGEYRIAKTACLSAQEHSQISAQLQRSVEALKANGTLPANWGQQPSSFTAAGQLKTAAGTFIWPIQQKVGQNYNSIYGVSNFVDLNAAYPNQVKDWNCGSRTYDNSNGYNHAGTDIFLWPFPQRMQDQSGAEIIAAAAGVIIAKADGYADHSCSLNGQAWNAVYVGNTDGTICWYGHMKNGSPTSKAVGQSVAQGEVLGIVGSSGNSTGPHLHFEVHTSSGAILDPYSGSCQPNASLWAAQKPYNEPTINALLTHSTPPVFPNCPTLETVNAKDTFRGGDPITYAAYFHDQDTDPATYEVKHVATGTVAQQWTFSPTQLYNASYWYWSRTAPTQPGAWTFNTTYKGVTVSHPFYVLNPAAVESLSGSASSVRVVPNPSKGAFFIEGLPSASGTYTLRVTDLLGRVLHQQSTLSVGGRVSVEKVLPKGLYLVSVTDAAGHTTPLRMVIE